MSENIFDMKTFEKLKASNWEFLKARIFGKKVRFNGETLGYRYKGMLFITADWSKEKQ